MILQALTKYYEALVKQGEVAEEGWSTAKVSYAISIDKDGKVRNIQSLLTEEQSGKKKVLVPTQKTVPLQKGRQSGKAPYYLCDNAKYLLGAWDPTGNEKKDKKNAEDVREYFVASALFHKSILDTVEDEQAKKLCRFFSTWDFERDKAVLNVPIKSLLGAKLIFRDYENPEEDFLKNEELIKAWFASIDKEREKMTKGRCLVTGEYTAIARTHFLIRGICYG